MGAGTRKVNTVGRPADADFAPSTVDAALMGAERAFGEDVLKRTLPTALLVAVVH